MNIPDSLIQLAVLVILVISAYRAIIFAKTKTLPDFLFNTSIALLAYTFLF
jgi:hypothetical protein